MNTKYLKNTVDSEYIINNKDGIAEKYVLMNNESSIKKVFNFFASDDKNILLLNGFAGTGKKQIIETFFANINSSVGLYRYVCTPSSTINDVFLELCAYFKTNYSDVLGQDFNLLNSYSDKVRFALERLEDTFVLAFYCFDNLLEDNVKDFLEYINSLNKNIKIVIVSRTFDSNEITDQDSYTKVVIKALTKPNFESYFNDYDIKLTGAKLEQLYRLTRGYFLYCNLIVRYLIHFGVTIDEYLNQYFASGQTFDKYLANSYYKLIIGTTKSAFDLFIQLRHGLNGHTLAEIGTFPDSVLKTLSDNLYVYKVNEMYYPSNMLKEYLKDDIKDVVYKSKLVKYYTRQLEKSVSDRDFIISKESLEKEVIYYTETDVANKVEKQKQEEPKIELLPEIKEEVKVDNEELVDYPQEQLISMATEAISNEDYIQSLKYLSVILTNSDVYERREIINQSYFLLAAAYSGLSKWEYAMYYLNLLEDFYRSIGDKIELANVLYKKGEVLFRQNKIIDSINILKRLLANTKDKFIIVKTNLLLANIALMADNRLLAMNYVKTGIANITDEIDMSIELELYFHYAFLSDEFNNEDLAIEYYNKCLLFNSEPNKFVALAYSNLGEIYYDNGRLDESKECFTKSSELEKALGNNFGVYYTLSKLVELIPRGDKENRLRLMSEARDFAINSGDNDSIIGATIALGDMFFDYSMPKDALIEYYNLYTQGKEIMEPDNLDKLRQRISDVKARLGKDDFEEIAPEYE